jgi:hypothetical protein
VELRLFPQFLCGFKKPIATEVFWPSPPLVSTMRLHRDLRGAFKGMHRLKYAQYIERVEAGLKSNPRCFFKFANLKRNTSGYPFAMFLGGACERNAQEMADLFGEYFQGVYVRDSSQEDFVVNDGVEDYSTVSPIQLEEETVEQNILALDTQKGP